MQELSLEEPEENDHWSVYLATDLDETEDLDPGARASYSIPCKNSLKDSKFIKKGLKEI